MYKRDRCKQYSTSYNIEKKERTLQFSNIRSHIKHYSIEL